MRQGILFMVLISIAGSVFPQCYFHKTYDYTGRNDGGFSIIQNSTNNFIIAGSSDEPVGIGDGTYAVSIDKCGNISWKSFNVLSPGSGGENIWEVFENIQDSTLVIFGSMRDQSEGKVSGLIFRLNSQGDSLYHEIINNGVGINDVNNTALQNTPNEYILGGYYNESPPNKLAFLSKVDSLGNIIWQKEYGDTTDGYRVKNIDRANDGGYIIGGSLNYGPSGAVQRLYLIKTDSAGNQQWEQHYPNTFYQGHVLATSDGGYLLAGNDRPSASVYHGYVGKMDSVGNILWQRHFDQSGDPGVIALSIESSDGNYIIVGDILKPNGGGVTYLSKISPNTGSIIWEREYSYFGGQSQNYLEDLIETREGDIAGTGYIIPSGVPNNTQNDMFVIKLDSCGYLENDSISANFSYSIDTLNKTVSFTNQSNEYCTSYWYFGDGGTSNEESPFHSYGDTSIYTVTLVVRAGNSTDTLTQRVNLSNCHETPLVDAAFNHEQDTLDIYTFSFTNESVDYCALSWLFGDGDSSAVTNPIHTFSDTGTYTITLIAYAGAYSDTFTREITIELNGVGIQSSVNNLKSEIKVYPNPTNNILHIESRSQNQDISNIQIIDLNGKNIIHSKQSPINTTALSQGIYFYQVEMSNGEVVRGKFVKE